MTNEELLRKYYAEHDEDALAQLYEQNMDLLWSIAWKSAKAFGCAESEVLDDLVSEGILPVSDAARNMIAEKDRNLENSVIQIYAAESQISNSMSFLNNL